MVRPPGCRVAALDHRAATELGLDPGTVVATRSIQRQTEEEERAKDLLLYPISLLQPDRRPRGGPGHAGRGGGGARGGEAGAGHGDLHLPHAALQVGHVVHVTLDT